VDPRVPPRLPQAGDRGRVDQGVDARPPRPRGLPGQARLLPHHGDQGPGPHRRVGLRARDALAQAAGQRHRVAVGVDGGGGVADAGREGAGARLQDLPGRRGQLPTWPPGWPRTS
jgi:hypothetical protein